MARSSKHEESGAEGRGVVRLVPTQKRSRERFERILTCAVEVIADKGSEDFRMSDIVERTGIAFGSLYQYFPDKSAIIGTLAERYNAIGRECVRKELTGLRDIADLHDTLWRMTTAYYQFFLDEPAVRDVWQATQVDRALRELDKEDGVFLTRLLFETLRPLAPSVPQLSLADFCQVVMVLIASAVRHAITLPPKEGARVLSVFKQVLPHDLDAAARPVATEGRAVAARRLNSARRAPKTPI